MAIGRGQHWTDERIAGRSVRRVVRNHANYETGGILAPTVHGIEQQQGPPSHWQGTWDFSHAQTQAPLQVYTRDSTDPGNRALMGINPSHRPDVWATWKAVNANAVEPTVTDAGATITYAGLWDGTDWRLQISPHRVKDYIELNDLTVAPRSFDWTIKLAPGCSLDARADGMHLLDGSGFSHGRITYPIAWDDSGSEEAPNVGVEMELLPGPGQFQTMRISVGAVYFDAARAAGWRIVIDPQVVISGGTDLDDNFLVSTSPNNNFGGYNRFQTSAGTQEAVLRVATSALPAGTVTAAKWSVVRITVTDTDAIPYKFIGSNSWGEGSFVGAPQTGASCANWAQYNTVPWAGGGPMLTSGVDYDNTDPGQGMLGTVYNTLTDRTLPVGWFNEWIGGTPNNGWALIGSAAVGLSISSQEASAGNRWTATLDYTTGPATTPYYYNMINNRRR